MQVQVEGSGRWPDDDEAAGKLRAALGCQMAQALESQFGLSARSAEAFVDVHVQGFAVRLKIWSNRDDTLADRAKLVCFNHRCHEALVFCKHPSPSPTSPFLPRIPFASFMSLSYKLTSPVTVV